MNILDCTLREGGYINDWNFGKESIQKIINNLSRAGIDYLECGFYKNIEYNSSRSIYNSLDTLYDFVPQNIKCALMINYGEVPIEFIPDNKFDNFYFRVAFKKFDRERALKFCSELQNKGYKVFVNSMATNSYTDNELLELIKQINKLNPYAYTLSDTFGCMQKKDIINTFKLADENLKQGIKLAFHSHNNMQLAFSNTQMFIEQKTSRDIIIDSTLMGMGRGGGNLSTEMIARYLNFKYDKNYNLDLILKTLEEQIQPIYLEKSWGYSLPYYISAINGCHPNYAKYMTEELKLSIERIYEIMQLIPEKNKLSYNKEVINTLLKE